VSSRTTPHPRSGCRGSVGTYRPGDRGWLLREVQQVPTGPSGLRDDNEGFALRDDGLTRNRRRLAGAGPRVPVSVRRTRRCPTHSEAPPEILNDLKNEVLAAAIDHINDHRYRTLAPISVEAEVDIFTTGISVDPNFGEFEEDLRRQDEEKRAAKAGIVIPSAAPPMPDIQVIARINQANSSREVALSFKPGGRRLNVGRASDNELRIIDASVSKIHAALLMTSEGTLLVADTGSTNGTFINGRRIAYGESRLIEDGDVVGFGDVEVRLRKSE